MTHEWLLGLVAMRAAVQSVSGAPDAPSTSPRAPLTAPALLRALFLGVLDLRATAGRSHAKGRPDSPRRQSPPLSPRD